MDDPGNVGIVSAPDRIQRRLSSKITPAFRVPSPTTRRRSLHPYPVVRRPRRHIEDPPEARVPSPPRVSIIQRVPSPPTVLRYAFRVPSPPLNQHPVKQHNDRDGFSDNTLPTIRRVFDYQHVPSNPPRSPFSPLHDLRRRSFDDRDTRSRTPQSLYPRVDAGYLSPPDVVDCSSSGGDQPQGSKRWKSERTPGPRAATPKVSITPPNSTFKSSHASFPGVLGDQGYQYRALQDLEFRLVKVFPEKKTKIKCEIIHTSLEKPPRYVAISYAWGDTGNTRKIELEGSLIPVGVNLFDALKALRQKVESVLVWVDALCIDQHNRDERAQQVRLMTGIYSAAESVAIWLGPEADDSALAIDLLCDLSDQADSPEKVSRLLSSRVGKPDLEAVVPLFERDY